MGSFTFDAGDLVAGDPPKDVWLESKPSAKLPPSLSTRLYHRLVVVSLTRVVVGDQARATRR